MVTREVFNPTLRLKDLQGENNNNDNSKNHSYYNYGDKDNDISNYCNTNNKNGYS